MSAGSIQSFEPIYGWGWHRGGTAVDVPDRFQLEISAATLEAISGLVQPPHIYADFTAALTLRHSGDGIRQWTVRLTSEDSVEPVTGFAQSGALV